MSLIKPPALILPKGYNGTKSIAKPLWKQTTDHPQFMRTHLCTYFRAHGPRGNQWAWNA